MQFRNRARHHLKLHTQFGNLQIALNLQNALRNLQIAQIGKMRGKYISLLVQCMCVLTVLIVRVPTSPNSALISEVC